MLLVGDKPRDEVDGEVERFAVAGMLNLRDMLELVVHRFYDEALAQKNLVLEFYQRVFHVLPDGGDEFYALFKQALE